MSSAEAKHTNRLVDETSPYLLQHAHNPVDWYPWGEQALERARSEDKPIFLSIGYSACHWCHVMERESFENEDIAAFLNEHFVSIKVDREERPDLDDVYMKATQVLSGHGGWPMSVFLTPDREPYYAGTYFPPMARYGQPAFVQVLTGMHEAWTKRRDQVTKQAEEVTKRVRQLALAEGALPPLGPEVNRPRLDLVDAAIDQLTSLYDAGHGGFGGPPKFPHADDIRLCLAQHVATGDEQALRMAEHTLDCMARGGIYDQLAGGFARYSTDGEWAIPHFEKMLYDNALLVPAYLEAHRITGRADFARVARECCDWVLSEMVDENGGLWSTQDADSEGEEGRFYVWQRNEVLELVGKQNARIVDVAWGLGEPENFEGHAWNLLRPRPDAELASDLGMTEEALHETLEGFRAKLLERRAERVRPGTDDKVLVAWNGLMISALARASTVLDEPRFLEAARAAARFCLGPVMRPDGRRLLATSRGGKAHIDATLADYAYLANGLLDLFEADGDATWADEARALAEVVTAHFADGEQAGFYMTADDAEELVARPRDLFDGALPSSNGVMVEVLVRLADLTGDGDLANAADRTFAMVEPLVRSSPSAFARILLALVRATSGRTVVIAGEGRDAEDLLRFSQLHPQPSTTVLKVPGEGVVGAVAARFPLLHGKAAEAGKATAHVCYKGSCRPPVHSVDELEGLLG